MNDELFYNVHTFVMHLEVYNAKNSRSYCKNGA